MIHRYKESIAACPSDMDRIFDPALSDERRRVKHMNIWLNYHFTISFHHCGLSVSHTNDRLCVVREHLLSFPSKVCACRWRRQILCFILALNVCLCCSCGTRVHAYTDTHLQIYTCIRTHIYACTHMQILRTCSLGMKNINLLSAESLHTVCLHNMLWISPNTINR